jgi:hypothetical protein
LERLWKLFEPNIRYSYNPGITLGLKKIMKNLAYINGLWDQDASIGLYPVGSRIAK